EIIRLRDGFESYFQQHLPWVKINGGRCPRIGNTTNVHFLGLDGQAIMAQLDVADICVSQSSACTNHKPTPSYVLKAMGLSEQEAYASVRFSFGETNTHDEIDHALGQLGRIVDRLSALERLA
ncbi:aminotransferase class V-fold PLP-dependent enzyme, partial [Roseovarius sp.]|uniref:aminotransferase class V-fold PLP-dependent enzyme n=1 Tax=Roseovarius sp. TaxID=1486281 RepID=UPI0035618F38